MISINIGRIFCFIVAAIDFILMGITIGIHHSDPPNNEVDEAAFIFIYLSFVIFCLVLVSALL